MPSETEKLQIVAIKRLLERELGTDPDKAYLTALKVLAALYELKLGRNS